MARVGSREAVALIHRPVVGQAIDVVVLLHVLLAGSLIHVAPDVVQGQRVNVTLDFAQVQAVVAGIVHGLHVLVRHLLVGEQHDIRRTIGGHDVERHRGLFVVQGEERPLALRQWRCRAYKLLLGYRHDGAALAVNAQCEVVGTRTLVQDGAAVIPLQPELHTEVAVHEHGVHRHGLVAEGVQGQRHVVMHLLLVQLRRYNDVVRTHVAGHDILVELY